MSKTFTVTRRKVSISKTVPVVIGVAGVARAGKDTLGNGIVKKLSKQGIPAIRLSFATAVKTEIDKIIKMNFRFSAFTEIPREKELIRPILVAFAEAARKDDPLFWVKRLKNRIETNIKNGVVSVITDVRFKEEVISLRKMGGFVIHLKRIGNRAANLVEKVNDPIVEGMADYKIKWRNFNLKKDACAWNINKLFLENNWSTYGEFKQARNGSSIGKQCEEPSPGQ